MMDLPTSFCNQLGGSMAVTTHLQILENVQRWEVWWWHQMQRPDSHCVEINGRPFLLPLHHVPQYQALALFHMSQNRGIPTDNIMGRHPIEHPPSILNDPTFDIYMSTRLVPVKMQQEGMEPDNPQNRQDLAPPLPNTFVDKMLMPVALDHISHYPKLWRSKQPHYAWASCWILSKHPQCSQIWHTCQQGCYHSIWLHPFLLHFSRQW